jgi:DNA (cytosine-5)-methyltransferase 1
MPKPTLQSLHGAIVDLQTAVAELNTRLSVLEPPKPAASSPVCDNKNAISLFSGAGGDTLGIERAGYKVIAFNEFKEPAIKTHKAVFPESVMLVNPETGKTDIKKVPDQVFQEYKGKVRLIFAGFPCQGFSHAGAKRVDDKRNELVYEFARAARIAEPEWIIGENVKGLLARKGRDPARAADAPLRPVIDIIKDLFERTGYKITYKVIDVTEIGVPQHRKRLIIIGHRGTQYPHMPWGDLTPASTSPQTSIRAFLEPHLKDAMEIPALYRPAEQGTHYWIPTTETVPTGTPHPNLALLVSGTRNPSSKEKKANPNIAAKFVEKDGLISFGVRKGGYHGMVVNPDVACNTIISTYNLCPRLFVGLHNAAAGKYWIRCMTPRELGQIQGFPADYAWQGTEKEQIIQIGNAVPPPLGERIVKSLERVVFKAEPQTADGAVEDDEESEDEEAATD